MDSRPRILLVDDDENIRDAFADALRFEGFAVESVVNGSDARDRLRMFPNERWLVLLDLMMPVLDGEMFLQLRRDDPLLACVPVIVLTAGGDCRRLKVALDVSECLPKTVRLDDLLAAIAVAGSGAHSP